MGVHPPSPTTPRVSVFRETGLFEGEQSNEHAIPVLANPTNLHVRFKGEDASVVRHCGIREPSWEEGNETAPAPQEKDTTITRTMIVVPNASTAATSKSSILYRFCVLALLVAISLPLVHRTSFLESSQITLPMAEGGVVRESASAGPIFDVEYLPKRANSPISICKRWSHQTAVVNGTLYIYGGRAMTDSSQTSNTWNNDFLSLDLTQSWQISSPSLKGFPQPSGPPAVANGFLWSSRSSLFLYGGEFSDNPQGSPTAASMWEYEIGVSSWKEHQNPITSAGNHATDDGNPVQRSAEGAGVNAPTLGRGWYFGGHLDFLTTQGWSYLIARVYLKSLIEFTFPGVVNSGVSSLSGGKPAGSDGVWRNITEGGLQDSAGFTERADGVLLYVPGFGKAGILLGLAGGTNATFTQMNIIDVYDIDSSTWYKQATSGSTPEYRVNPCAVVAAAADGSSYNVYMFGGQNLLPYGQQTQYQDMWILSIPSFTWIQVDTSKQSVPYGRSGHTCDAWDGQMVVVGGYVGQDLSCDSPGFYVFNMSSCQWANQFTSISGQQGKQENPFSQQLSQMGSGLSSGPAGSYGYAVPPVIYSTIGGGPTGGATITAPVQTPTAGPLATGKPQTYTVTAPNGQITTASTPPNHGAPDSNNSSGSKVGTIVAGVIAGIFAMIAGYFAFCAWVYRKQLNLYKHHTAIAQQAVAEPQRNEKPVISGLFPVTSSDSSNRDRHSHGGTGPNPSSEFIGLRAQRTSSGENSGISSGPAGPDGYQPIERRSMESEASNEDLLAGHEPTFWGVVMGPRKSLRVINRD